MNGCTPGTLLAFDFGLRRIGVAVGQEITGTARPLTILPARDGKPDWAAVTSLIETWKPRALVVGLPLNMDGTEQDITALARRFGRQLEGRYNLPVYTEDERLSSVEAEARHREAAGAIVRREAIDHLAAQVILETWLNRHRQHDHSS